MNRFGAAPQTNLEVVEQGYEHFNDGDIQWVLDHLDQRIVWEDARQMPDARIYRGLEEVRKCSLIRRMRGQEPRSRAARQEGNGTNGPQ